MSYQWSFTSNNSNGLIEKIYCSYVNMSIPLEYDWYILFKDGSEINFEDINKINLTDLADLNAIEQAKMNIALLNNNIV
jgi:hypothetical protein